jgi:hypothetical protein
MNAIERAAPVAQATAAVQGSVAKVAQDTGPTPDGGKSSGGESGPPNGPSGPTNTPSPAPRSDRAA